MEIIEKIKNGLTYYQFKRFNQLDWLEHIFTSKIGWDNESISEKLSKCLDMPESKRVSLKQVHGTHILLVDSCDKDFDKLSKLEGDGLITDLPGIILSTNHADCVPIYFVDLNKKVIGVAHGGWRGTYGNMTRNMIDKMKGVYNSNAKDILVGIGPSIGPCCYEVGMDLVEMFKNRYPNFSNIFVEKDDKVLLDLWRINYLQARDMGIEVQNIIVSEVCTSCNVDKFHSYRKEGGTKGRMVTAIGLRSGA